VVLEYIDEAGVLSLGVSLLPSQNLRCPFPLSISPEGEQFRSTTFSFLVGALHVADVPYGNCVVY
jgi:hypothetical protein